MEQRPTYRAGFALDITFGITKTMTPTPQRLVEYWLYRASRMQEVFYMAGRGYAHRHKWLGIPAVLMGAIVGSTIFVALSKETDIEIKLITGALSVLATLLTALQTFLKDYESSEKYRMAGAKMAHIKHTLELLQVLPPKTDDELRSKMFEIETEWDKVRAESPNLPPRLWKKVEASLTFEGYLARDPLSRKGDA